VLFVILQSAIITGLVMEATFTDALPSSLRF